MLVLTRKNSESVVVGDSSCIEHVLKITVMDVKGNKVRLGFEAGDDIPVYRWEVWERACGSNPSGNERLLIKPEII